MFRIFINLVSLFLCTIGFRGIHILSCILAFFVFSILKYRRRVILTNLGIAFPHMTLAQKKHLGRQCLQSFARTLLEFWAGEKLYQKAEIELNMEENNCNAKKYENTGVYGLCVHMGNWELMAYFFTKNFKKLNIISKKVGKGKLADWVYEKRKEHGVSVIDRLGSRSATRQIFEILDRKEVVGVIVDQKRARGENLPFFGRLTKTNNSLPRLYFQKKAPVVPIYMQWLAPGKYKIHILNEVEFPYDKKKTHAENVTHATQMVTKIAEQMIRENPGEYFWNHNRWEV